MITSFDLVVIGTGTAASSVASRCRSAGWNVAVVDSRPFGGTCALRGCDPKKVLVGASEVIDWTRRMDGKGVDPAGAKMNWQDLIRFKRTFTEPVAKSHEQSLSAAGIAAYHGRARFVAPTSVRVGDDVLEARHFVIASGAMPATLKIPGEEHLSKSDEFLELDQLPSSIVFIGGGYIAFEFAHVAVRAGAKVTILHRGSRLLEHFDPDLVDKLTQRTRTLGVDVRLGANAVEVSKTSGGFAVRAMSGDRSITLEAAMVVHAAGRVPEIEDLDLAAAGVERKDRGVAVNEYLQSLSNPAVYAAGDAAGTGGPPLTPVAGYEGSIVAANLLHGNHSKAQYTAIPTVVFTTPPLASVGLTEEAAAREGLQFHTNFQDTSSWYSSRRVGESCSGSKVLVETGTGRILGAHLLGPSADELINIFTLAMRGGLTAKEIKEVLFAYPTHSSDIQYML